jgi:uncharacterized repeat protein (TIGR04076 family)
MRKEETEKMKRKWQKLQEYLGYTDEELAIFRSYPKHVKSVESTPELTKNKTVIEVIESHNCGAGYKVGDKFVVGADACLVLDECAPKLCIGALAACKELVDKMWQAFYDDRTEVFQDTVRCPDVGVHRGGWGEVTMKVYSVPIDK